MHEQRRPRHHAARRAVAPCAAPLALHRGRVNSQRREKTARTHDHVRTERCVLRVHGAFPFGVLAVWSGNCPGVGVFFLCHPGHV